MISGKRLLLALSVLFTTSGVAEAQFAGAYGPLVRLPQLTVSSAQLQAAANPGANPPSNFSVTGLTGGAALSGNNTGGTAAAITITGGPGGPSTGNVANAAGEAITLQGGAAGTGGGGAAGAVGQINLNTTTTGKVQIGPNATPWSFANYAQNLLVGDVNTTTAFRIGSAFDMIANVAGGAIYDVYGEADTGITGTAGVWGAVFGAEQLSSGPTTSITGVQGYFNAATGSGLIGTATGVSSVAYLSFGSATTADEFSGTSSLAGGTVVTNFNGLQLTMPNSVGITNQIGISIGPVTSAGTVNESIQALGVPFASATNAMVQLGIAPSLGNAAGTFLSATTTGAYTGDFANFTVAGVGKFLVAGTGVTSAVTAQSATLAPLISSSDWDFPVSTVINITGGANAAWAQHTTLNPSTVRAVSLVTNTVGVGAGAFVIRLRDTTAAATKATCTSTCLTAIGTVLACTINSASVAAADVLQWQIVTQCGTTNPLDQADASMSTP